MKSTTAAFAFAIATLVATSASASYRHIGQQEQPNRYRGGPSAAWDSRASVAFEAQARPHTHSTHPAHDVHVGGRYVGSDPDPFIRGMISQEGILQQR